MTEALEALDEAMTALEVADLAAANGSRVTACKAIMEAVGYLKTLRAALSAEPVDDRIGKWLSAALEDSSTCAEMRADIEAWFASRAAEEDFSLMGKYIETPAYREWAEAEEAHRSKLSNMLIEENERLVRALMKAREGIEAAEHHLDSDDGHLPVALAHIRAAYTAICWALK
jgi:hypothetical protein